MICAIDFSMRLSRGLRCRYTSTQPRMRRTDGSWFMVNDDGSIIDDVVLCAEEGRYGVNISKGVWHTIEAIEADSVIFECKEGPFVEHEKDGILNVEKND